VVGNRKGDLGPGCETDRERNGGVSNVEIVDEDLLRKCDGRKGGLLKCVGVSGDEGEGGGVCLCIADCILEGELGRSAAGLDPILRFLRSGPKVLGEADRG
jgi:hypothetical protein